MTNQEMSAVITALRSKPTQTTLNEQEFVHVYSLVLKDVDASFVPALVRWILTECGTFMPTTEKVHAYAQRLGGHIPVDGRRVIAEIRRHIAANGANCVPVPGRPACFLPGPPPDLSPQARALVEARGGWQAVVNFDLTANDYAWHETAKEAAELCDQLKIDAIRQQTLTSSPHHLITSSLPQEAKAQPEAHFLPSPAERSEGIRGEGSGVRVSP